MSVLDDILRTNLMIAYRIRTQLFTLFKVKHIYNNIPTRQNCELK